MAKKYKLHCFGCGSQFYNKEGVERIDGKPYCGECMGSYYSAQQERYEREEFYRKNPNWTEQDDIDRANVARYGEC